MSAVSFDRLNLQAQLETVDTGQLDLDQAVPPTTIDQTVLQDQNQVEEPVQPGPVAVPEPQQEPAEADTTVGRNETTLIANEEEAFALEPLDITGAFCGSRFSAEKT